MRWIIGFGFLSIALAQEPRPAPFVIGVNGNTGTVSSIATGCGTSGGTITSSGTIKATEPVNTQTGTTYTYLDGDCGKLVSHSNAAAIAGTLPQANGSTFVSGWFTDAQNSGAGTLTITPTTSTIDGASSLALTTGQGVRIVSNGTNYFTQRGVGGGVPTSLPIGVSITGGTTCGQLFQTGSSLDQDAANNCFVKTALATPAAPAISVQGVSGATTYTYLVLALTQVGTVASITASTAIGNAALSGSNFNRITPVACATGQIGWIVYRTVGGVSQGRIGGTVACAGHLDDVGLTPSEPYTASGITLNGNTTAGQFYGNNFRAGSGSNSMLFRPYDGLGGGLYIGGFENFFGVAGEVIFPPLQSVENYFGFRIASNTRGYFEHGFYLLNTTTGDLQDIFYTGAQATLSGAAIADQSWYVESVPDYVAEIAVRQKLITYRSLTNACWNSTDNAGLFDPPTPDVCLFRVSPGVLGVSSDTSSTLAQINASVFNSSSLTASLPVLTDSSKNLISGTLHGNTTRFQMSDNTGTSGNLAKFDASGNTVDGGLSAASALASVHLSGTTGSIGGGLLAAGACTSGTVAVTSSTTSMVALADPNTYPGDGIIWDAQVTTNGTVTVKVCAILALTPAASTYNVRVIQ